MDLSAAKKLKALVVGDAIMDEYVYVRVVGKAVKENALSAMRGKTERFKGGVWAAAEHLKNFCASVDILTGYDVMWNSRMVDDVYLRKLFVTHELRENELWQNMDEYSANIHPINEYDLVMICDFGHGALSENLIKKLSKEARFLAVNAQTNATNFGFNVITKYPRADYVVIDELEARLAIHDNASPINDVLARLPFANIVITQGIHGAIGKQWMDILHQPAATDHVLDTMGAGDAFLSVTAPFAALGWKMPELLKLGNAAAAAKVAIIGHRKSVTQEDVENYLGRMEH